MSRCPQLRHAHGRRKLMQKIAAKPKPDPAAAFLPVALDQRWKKFRLQLKLCQRDFSESAVHDLRVAARRLLAVLDLARALEPHPRVQKSRRWLKTLLDALDDLRDTQVMRMEAIETGPRLPELEPIRAILAKREKRLLRESRAQIRALKLSDPTGWIAKIGDSLESQARAPRFPETLLALADAIFLRVNQNYIRVDGADASTIHRLRLSFKKFRYTVEIVHPLCPAYPATHLGRMHDYQGMMGGIQDVETFLQFIADYYDSASSFDLERVRRFYEARRAERLAAFLEGKSELLTFWRAAPDQPFPWETQHDPLPHSTRHRGRVAAARSRR
jgi:CHAD domain-containing protein